MCIMDSKPMADDSRHDAGLGVIYWLYLGFFLVWCAGLIIGEVWTGADQPYVLGMPLWFFVGCVASFAGVSVALILCARRYFE